VLAVGEHLWGEVDERTLRISSALAGGLGCSHEEMCGALSGGSLLLGSLYGRSDPAQDDDEFQSRVRAYRDRFLEAFGETRCGALRAGSYGPEGKWPCSTLVERATRLLLDEIENR